MHAVLYVRYIQSDCWREPASFGLYDMQMAPEDTQTVVKEEGVGNGCSFQLTGRCVLTQHCDTLRCAGD
jgi:hypothetical protein